MRYLTFILIVFLLDSCKHDSNIKAGSEVYGPFIFWAIAVFGIINYGVNIFKLSASVKKTKPELYKTFSFGIMLTTKDLKNFELDSILSIDSNNLILNINIDSFLIKPFDLLTFKLKKNGSLSSGANFKDYHFKPDFEGVGYCFFMFEPKNTNIIIDGKEIKHSKVGYLGRDKANLAILEDGLKIKTFQPNDEFKNNYLNPKLYIP
jgi:hypothetical protein